MKKHQAKKNKETKLINKELWVQLISTSVAAIAICISMWQFSENIKVSILQSKVETTLAQTSELPYLVAEICTNATNVAAALYIGEDNLDEINRQEYIESRLKQDELLVKIKNMIYAYGSVDAINILNEFIDIIKPTTHTDIKAYYLLSLLLSQVKLDVTGETVHPVIFIDGLMPQFKDHKENIKSYINEEIDKLKLIDLRNNLNNKEN